MWCLYCVSSSDTNLTSFVPVFKGLSILRGKKVSLTGAQRCQDVGMSEHPDALVRLVQITCRIVELLLGLDVAW